MVDKIYRPAHQLPEPDQPKSYKWHIVLTLILVIGVTIGIFSYVIEPASWQLLWTVKFEYLLLALLAAFLGIWIDARRLLLMVRLGGDQLTQVQGMKVLFGNYFFSFFTPGATGGPIAQFILLRHFGISGSKATLFVITRTLFSLGIMILLMPFIFYTENDIGFDIPAYLPLVLSAIVLAGLSFSFWLGRSPTFIRWSRAQIFLWAPKKFQKKLLKIHQDLSGVISLFSHNPRTMLVILLQTAISLTVSYSMVCFLFLGLGVIPSPFHVLGRMFFLNFLLHFAPTPGGTGIAEGLFIMLFASQNSQSIAGIAALLWRILSEYIPAIIGLIVMMQEFGYEYIKKRYWGNQEVSSK